MESVKPPGVEDCPSPMNQESYQDVVVSGVVGTVVVVVVVVVVSLDLIFLRISRIRAILIFRSSVLSCDLCEYLLLTLPMRFLLLAVECCALVGP